MDGDERAGKPQENRLFTIPTAKEIARLEHGKSKVRSYFKSQFGKPNVIDANKDGRDSGDGSTTAAPPPGNPVTSGASESEAQKPEGPSARHEQTNGQRTGGLSSADRDPGLNSASTSSAAAPGEVVRDKRKIGSAFAEKFAALRQDSDYQEPTIKRPTLSTAVVAAPVASGPKAPSGANTIIVNTRQRGNPVLKHIRNVPWEFGDIVPDYVMGRTLCALYLSLRYHHLNPNYIHDRLKDLGHNYELRVLLVQVDVKDPHHSLKELARMAILADCTLILAWSTEEAGRYLETYKSYESKSAEALKEKVDADYLSKVTDVLSTVKSVNKTDAVTLMSTFGSFDNVIAASKEDLYLCPGFGPQKAQRLYDVLHQPFLKTAKDRSKDAAQETTAAATEATTAAATTATAATAAPS